MDDDGRQVLNEELAILIKVGNLPNEQFEKLKDYLHNVIHIE